MGQARSEVEAPSPPLGPDMAGALAFGDHDLTASDLYGGEKTPADRFVASLAPATAAPIPQG